MVALFSCEAKYIVAAMAACKHNDLIVDMLLDEVKLRKIEEINLLVDTKSTIDLTKYQVAHGRSKHIETKFHFLHDQVNKLKLKLEYYRSEEYVDQTIEDQKV